MEMRTERFPAGYDYRSRFSDLIELGGNEGGVLFAARDGHTPVFISDESTLLDLLDEDDTTDAIAVSFFSDEESRDAHARRTLARMRGLSEAAGQTHSEPETSVASRRTSRKVSFKNRERQRQADFKLTLSAESQVVDDEWGRRHPFLLPLGREEDNLFEALRGRPEPSTTLHRAASSGGGARSRETTRHAIAPHAT